MRRKNSTATSALESQHINMLAQMIADIHTRDEAVEILSSLLTSKEQKTIANRLAIAYYIAKGKASGDIKQNLKVSTAEINSIKKVIKSKGLVLALKKIEAEEFAARWSERIKRFAGK